ncbi:PadR family transcriptional regulator [Gorillibacterium timonense]|uniref:PadR family transcriptional regulator n=1 Tax=Gorillibacterium timonense TaxID=1689269 RepID=UPI00071E28E6|nr:PadR family transcriptional regulator [Gorillibacterium timonense]
MDMSEWKSQVRRGLLEFCILRLIGSQPRYGYELVTTLNRWEFLAVTEGTLYPLLRRLLKEKCIDSYWKESEAGPPRKYYTLTESGRELLDSMSTEWEKVTQAIEELNQ